ncbi:hypothetical protein CASFOL_000202 [Castilleja foliolosa]|uniref:Protein kinase domain-containing protein n=1 Tax=Castilleja foliolosa TaxID=1961234 RepID=A0ABD3ENK0_9LAMI
MRIKRKTHYCGPSYRYKFKTRDKAEIIANKFNVLGKSPNIARYYDFTKSTKHFYVHVERGTTLSEHLDTMRGTGNLIVAKMGGGTLLNPTDTFQNLFRDYFSVVSYMHERNFVHGSIDIDR